MGRKKRRAVAAIPAGFAKGRTLKKGSRRGANGRHVYGESAAGRGLCSGVGQELTGKNSGDGAPVSLARGVPELRFQNL